MMNEDIKHLIGDEVPEPIGWHRCSSNVIFQAFWMNMNLIFLLMNFTDVQTLFRNLKYTILCICVYYVFNIACLTFTKTLTFTMT